RLLERPVLDAKGLAARQRYVVMTCLEFVGSIGAACLRQPFDLMAILERGGARHDVYGIGEELSSDASFLLALSESKQSEPRDDDDRWICVAQRGRVRGRAPVVVLLVVTPIRESLSAYRRLQRLNSFSGRVPFHEQRTDARAQKMIRATRAQRAQLRRPRRAGERQCVL